MVKKSLVQVTVCTLLFIFILNFFGNEAEVANELDLNKMNEVVKKHNGKMTEWSIFAREELPQGQHLQDLENLIVEWEKKFPQLIWTKNNDSNRISISGTVSNKSLHYVENLQIVANLNENNTIQGFIIYEMKGTKWNTNLEEIVREKSDQFLTEIFHNSTVIFSCIKGVFSDKIDKAIVEKSKRIVEDFHGTIVEKLEEKNFTSLTVHSPYFSNEMPTESGTFNMQIALRENGIDNKTTFVIGTPILTIEY